MQLPEKNPLRPDDDELLARYRADGRTEHLAQLYLRHTELVYGVALHLLRNRADAEDVVMQLFEELIVKARRHEIRNFRSWLHTVCRNLCLMRLRREGRMPPAEMPRELPDDGQLIALHRAERFEAPTLAEQTPRPEEKVEEDLPFVSAETLPRFQGQDLNGFRKWVQERITPSKIVLGSGIPGRVVVSFVIDTTGRLTQIRILQSPDRSLSDEVVRVLKQSPRWEPGRQFDRKVPVKFCIPVDFRQRQQPTKQDRNRD